MKFGTKFIIKGCSQNTSFAKIGTVTLVLYLGSVNVFIFVLAACLDQFE